jgi:hypothetical protein
MDIINNALQRTLKKHSPAKFANFIETVATRNMTDCQESDKAFGIDICEEHVIKSAIADTVRFIELLALNPADADVIKWHVIAPPLTRKAAVLIDFNWKEVFKRAVGGTFHFDYINEGDKCIETMATSTFVHEKSSQQYGALNGMYGIVRFEDKNKNHVLSMFELDEMIQARDDWQNKIVGMVDVSGLDELIVCLRLIHEMRSSVDIQRNAHLPEIAKHYQSLFEEHNKQAKAGIGNYGVVVQMSKTEERLLELLPQAKGAQKSNGSNVVSMQETMVDHYLSFFD